MYTQEKNVDNCGEEYFSAVNQNASLSGWKKFCSCVKDKIKKENETMANIIAVSGEVLLRI